MKRCLICIEAVCGGYASSNKHSKYHPAVPSPTTLINSSDLCLYIHFYSFFTLVVACNTGKLCWSSAKFAPFHFWGESRMNYIEGALEWISKTFFWDISQFSFFSFYISVSDFNWKLGQHASHLPGGHLAVVAPRVVVPGEQLWWMVIRMINMTSMILRFWARQLIHFNMC